MSDDRKTIKELEKLTGKEFTQKLSLIERDFSFAYKIEGEDVVELGVDLTILNLDSEKLMIVEDSIKKLENLKRFNIKITKDELPEWIKELTNLEHLGLSQNKFKELPDWIEGFKHLKSIDLTSNDIKNLPDSLLSLNDLKELKIEYNNNLEWSQKNLDLLKTLFKRNVEIKAPRLFKFQYQVDLPKEQIEIIREIEKENTEKEKIHTYVNPINMKIEDGKVVNWRMVYYPFKSLPENFNVFKDLKSLTITETSLESLPDSFGDLTNLLNLDLSKNKLKKLPESFINLTSIKNLDLSDNQLDEIPTVLWPLNDLIEFNISNNPLNDEEKTIIQKNPDVIRNYLRKKATIAIFISHAVIDYETYQIENLVDFLKNQKEISEVYFCEEDLAGNIDEWMLDTVQKCQLVLFIGTKKSVFNSADCDNELQLAEKYSIPIIPLKGNDIDWTNLAEKNLSRELGLEYDKDNFEEFCNDLYKYIYNFKREIDLMGEKERQKGIINIYERFRLILDEKLSDINRKLTELDERIKKLE